ncbi:hypothetical protein ACEYYB_02555 [Paracoccus sp. p4-l81]|uniref:hypothetical protein n=1 Tax=unclassified Paracoccus (in: a-proteobacteria) TaxID=2688777 RepID=UPI0035B905DA
MLRNLDLSNWHSLLSTILTLALITLIGVGLRVLMMVTIQQRRERANRQINERLKVLIAAYKTLGGSFTGSLTVDPTHLRDLRATARAAGDEDEADLGSDRSRRIRDAVEGALSDILLLGTEDQVRLAEAAARDLVAGRRIATAQLVASLRDFIRSALDLDPIPQGLAIPLQGPTRPGSGGSGRSGGSSRGGGGRGGGGGAGGAGGGGMAMGLGMGAGGAGAEADPLPPTDLPR